MVILYSLFLLASISKDCGIGFNLGAVMLEVRIPVYPLMRTTIIRSQKPNIIRREKRDIPVASCPVFNTNNFEY